MSIEIRQAGNEDLELLRRDVKPAVGRTFEKELEEQSRGIHSLFIAVNENDVVGWGFVRWAGPRDIQAEELFPDAPEIYRLEVREKYRSSGIGRRLIAEMEAVAVLRGFSEVSLGVDHENPRAYSLYKELGFGDTELDEYFDEYQYPLKEGGFETARDLCRYLVKQL